MSIPIRLSDQLIELAQTAANPTSRSMMEQIEHWARIGKLVEDNPDLPYALIREIQQADREPASGTYTFEERRIKNEALRREFVEQAKRSWEETMATGLAYDGDEFFAYIKARLKRQDVPKPSLTPWKDSENDT
jgi:hypothetical protein